MKSKPILVLSIIAISTLLLACAPKQVSVELSCDDFYKQEHISKEVEVAVGDSFTVTLCSNPTTGFLWSETAQISDQSVLQQIEHKYVAPAGRIGCAPPAPGTPGQEVWTFKAVKEGASSVSLEYSRPWEGGEKGEWTFNLTVVVK